MSLPRFVEVVTWVTQVTFHHKAFNLYHNSMDNIHNNRVEVHMANVTIGVGNAFLRISSTEGLQALWHGVSFVILGAGPR